MALRKGVERALAELVERILDRERLGAGEHRMLKDVRDTGRVRRRRAEADAEEVLLVVAMDGQDLRAGLVVRRLVGPRADVGQLGHAGDGEAVRRLAAA
jgi:hypothetical protein